MKKITLIVLIGIVAMNAQGQHKNTATKNTNKRKTKVEIPASRHNLFTDIGYNPGFSITYNYKTARHWGVGMGLQGYSCYPTGPNFRQFTTAVYAEGRLYIRPLKNNQFFSFLDLGVDFYEGKNRFYSRDGKYISYAPSNHGVYTGLGLGYFRRMTKRGGGPYASLKMIVNWFKADEYNVATKEQKVVAGGYGNVILSLGFKF